VASSDLKYNFIPLTFCLTLFLKKSKLILAVANLHSAKKRDSSQFDVIKLLENSYTLTKLKYTRLRIVVQGALIFILRAGPIVCLTNSIYLLRDYFVRGSLLFTSRGNYQHWLSALA